MYIITIKSRNKDNHHLAEFKERSGSFVATTDTYTQRKLDEFTLHSAPSEVTRVYRTINPRNTEKINRELIKYLLDHPSFDLAKLESKVASIASKAEHAATHRWLLDLDTKEPDILEDVLSFIPDDVTIDVIQETPNGRHIIIDHGFDTRALLTKHADVLELHRDGRELLNTFIKPSI